MRSENKIILNDIEQNILNKIWNLPKYERLELYKVLTDWCLNGLLMEAEEMAHNDTLE